jgi:histone H3
VTNLCAIHAKRVTIQQKDMKLVQALRLCMTGSKKVGQHVGLQR